MARKLKNFIDGFLEYTNNRGSPKLFRLWAAIYIIGAAIERKRWIVTAIGKTYPNQYVLLVGPAGVGKSLCTSLSHDLLKAARSDGHPLHIAPTSVTKASLIDALADAERAVVRPMEAIPTTRFNSLAVVVNEFGVFLPSWEGEFMSVLTDLWDCKRYAETRRTSKTNIEIADPQLNLFSATTPAHLNTLLPEGAWEQGFMSRMLVVYSGETIYTDLFKENPKDAELFVKLENDLKEIHEAWGEMTFTDEAKLEISSWAQGGAQPAPTHPKLHSYCSRRVHHLLKLCMIASAAEDNEGIITADHFKKARGWLTHMESQIPEVFKSMKAGGDGQTIQDCWHFCYQYYMKDQALVPEATLWEYLQERTPAHNVERLIHVMVQSKLLEKQFMDTGQLGYKPKTKRSV